jgi:hypothetical protein
MKWLACFWPSLVLLLGSSLFAMMAGVSLYRGYIGAKSFMLIYSRNPIQFMGFVGLAIVCSLLLGLAFIASLQMSAAIRSAGKRIERLEQHRGTRAGK